MLSAALVLAACGRDLIADEEFEYATPEALDAALHLAEVVDSGPQADAAAGADGAEAGNGGDADADGDADSDAGDAGPIGPCGDRVDGSGCDDNDACTAGDRCKAGLCIGEAIDCEDGNTCTHDECIPATGCTHDPVAGPEACDDGDMCTTGAQCTAGICGGGQIKTCGDGNDCTEDGCDPKTGACTHDAAKSAGQPCGATACTLAGTCLKGVCSKTSPIDCDDGNGCTDDGCSVKTQGCWHVDNSAACDDGDLCTGGDRCSGGVCAGVPLMVTLTCDDKDPCTADACVKKVGCVHPKGNDGAACDDGNACTVKDACAAGACAGLPLQVSVACDDGNVCTDDGCDPKAGGGAMGCTHVHNGVACDDGDACTLAGTCSGGGCGKGPPGLWQRTWGGKLGDGLFAIAPWPGGGALVAGTAESDGKTGKGYVALVSAASETTWSREVGEGYAVFTGVIAAGPGAVAAGYLDRNDDTGGHAFVVGLKATGADGWTRTFGQGNSFVSDIAATSKGFVVVGRTSGGGLGGKQGKLGGEDGWLVALAANGIPLWDRVYGGPGLDGLHGVALRPGGYVACGTTRKGSEIEGWVLGLDASGKVAWQHALGASGVGNELRAIVADSKGGWLAAGGGARGGTGAKRGWLVRGDAAGKIAWERNVGHDVGVFYDVAATGAGFVASGALADNAPWAGWLVHVDVKGGLLVDRAFGGKHNDTLSGVLVDGKRLVLTGTWDKTGDGSGDAWLLRTDLWGNASCDVACPVKTLSTCADAKPCTLDHCKATTCLNNTGAAAACDDGNPCTVGDTCKNSACVGAANPCDDGIACTIDACVLPGGCVHKPAKNGSACDDGEAACKALTTCEAGKCGGGQDALWSSIYVKGKRSTTLDVALTGDGGVAQAIRSDHQDWDTGQLMVRKLDAAGKQSWLVKYPLAPSEPARVRARADGSVLVAGRVSEPGNASRGVLWAIGAGGKVVWDRRYGLDGSCLLDVRAAGTGLIAAGRTVGGIGDKLTHLGADDAWLIRADDAGKPIWNRAYGGAGPDAFEAVVPVAGGFIAGGVTRVEGREENYIVGVDGAGKPKWTYVSSPPPNMSPQSSAGRVFDLLPLPDGGAVAVTDWSYKGGSRASVARLSPVGEVVWRREWESYGFWLKRAVATSEGFIAVGTRLVPKDGKMEHRAWVVWLDPRGRPLRERTYGGTSHARGLAIDRVGPALVIGGLLGQSDVQHDAHVVRLDVFGNGQCGDSGGCATMTLATCSDGSPCTTDGCGKGKCTHANLKDGTGCDGKDACQGGSCSGGTCSGISPKKCDDANACTSDGCDTEAGCVNTLLHDGCDGVAHGGTCFKAFVASAIRDKAEQRCVQWGGHLARIDSAGASETARQQRMKVCGGWMAAWIGLGDAAKDGAWVWADGAKLGGYTNWAKGQPDGGAAATAVQADKNGAWHDAAASDDPGCFLCSRPLEHTCGDGGACTPDKLCVAGACVTGPKSICDDGNGCTADSCSGKGVCTAQPLGNGSLCSDGDPCLLAGVCDAKASCRPKAWTLCDDGKPCTVDGCAFGVGCSHVPHPDTCDGMVVGGRCLKAWKGRFTFRSARNACLAWGGDLPTVHSAAHNAAVRAVTKGTCSALDMFFLGATDLEAEGSFRWLDGSPWDFSAFGPQQPDNSGARGEHALTQVKDGTWHDMSHLDAHTPCLVCERPIARPCTTSACKGGMCKGGACEGKAEGVFLKPYGGSGKEQVFAVVALAGGGVVSAGATGSKELGVAAGMDGWVIAHEPDGSPRWSRLIAGDATLVDGVGGLIVAPGGQVVACGWVTISPSKGTTKQLGRVNWLDPDKGKDIAAANVVFGAGAHFSACGAARDGFVAVGRGLVGKQELGLLVRYDAGGKGTWLTSHNYGKKSLVFLDAAGDAMGKRMVAVGRYIADDSEGRAYFGLFSDKDGKYVSQAVDGSGVGQATAVAWLADGGLIAAGHLRLKGDPGPKLTLWRRGQDLKLAWSKTLGPPGQAIGDMVVDRDGSFVLVGASLAGGGTAYKPLFARVDAGGKLLHSRVLPVGKASALHAIALRPDAGFWVAGSTSDSGGDDQALLGRLDAWGHHTCKGAGSCAGKAAAACADGKVCQAGACVVL